MKENVHEFRESWSICKHFLVIFFKGARDLANLSETNMLLLKYFSHVKTNLIP